MSEPTLILTNVTSTDNLPNGLTSLTFSYNFNQPISEVKWPPSLQTLDFIGMFNQPISDVKWPPNLHTLSFGEIFNQDISDVKWPPNLQKLTFRSYFDRPISDVKFPESLQTLTFGYYFNQDISEVKWPPNLQTLSFGDYFNQPISEVEWSSNLQTLFFGEQFNQSISEVKWPPNLQNLEFGNDFNQPISEVKWPPSLQTLTFGYDFDQPIFAVEWPRSLQTLTFGELFNQSISEVKWPSKIKIYRHYLDNTDHFVTNMIYPTLRQREQLTKILNKKNQPKTLSLPKPNQWTKWQQLCHKSKSQLTDQDRQQLQTYAKVANIANYDHLTATQLCIALAQHLEPHLQRIKQQPKLECQNEATLEGDDFSDMPQENIIQDDKGYCFTKSELSRLDKHPYTNQSWDQVRVKGQPILTYAEQINPQLAELHQMFPSQERTLSVESLRTHELTDIINHSGINPQSTKYLHPHDFQKYDTKPHDRQRILSEVITSHLSPNFVKSEGNSYLDWINNLRTYIMSTPMTNRETIKYLIVELLKPHNPE